MKNLKFYLFIICVMTTVSHFSQRIVIAHRGASGYLPEHSMESKIMAYEMGAQFIEQDIVLTKDDVPIVHHDLILDETTDVATVYPYKKRSDGHFYVIDFTWEQLQKLKLHERVDGETRLQKYPGRFDATIKMSKIHTLQEEIEVIQALNKVMFKDVGIYVEIKEPGFHNTAGKDISKIVLDILTQYHYTSAKDPCYVQCFDPLELMRIRKNFKSELRLVQLLEIGYYDTYYKGKSVQTMVQEIATYANAIGPWYKQLSGDEEVTVKGYQELGQMAHLNGLNVHFFTLRSDDLGQFKSFEDLMFFVFFDLSADGVFTDFPDKVLSFIKRKNP